tara:strand:+ start:553 stop:678 length:126 start_codon:yes stop_codon:yes gene_type:complete
MQLLVNGHVPDHSIEKLGLKHANANQLVVILAMFQTIPLKN